MPVGRNKPFHKSRQARLNKEAKERLSEDVQPLQGFLPNPATGNSNAAHNKSEFPAQIGSDEPVPEAGDRLGSQTILESPESVDSASLVSGLEEETHGCRGARPTNLTDCDRIDGKTTFEGKDAENVLTARMFAEYQLEADLKQDPGAHSNGTCPFLVKELKRDRKRGSRRNRDVTAAAMWRPKILGKLPTDGTRLVIRKIKCAIPRN